MKIETVNITPAMAVQFLLANTRNRSLNEKRVQHLSQMIARGEWQFNGSPIVFDRNGVLIDGQHRLAAIHRANMPCETLVICGVDESAQITVDTGRPRTVADQLVLMGVSNSVAISALLARIYFWELVMRQDGKKDFMNGQHGDRPTTKQLLNLFDRIGNAELQESVSKAHLITKRVRISRGELAHSYFMFRAIDGEDAEDFTDLLESGSGLIEGHPIFAFRRLMEKQSPLRVGYKRNWHRALLIKTWNAYRDGDQIQVLRFTLGGANPEIYPIPR